MDAPKTVEEIYEDFCGRRAALVAALTTDVGAFFEQCDPNKENLCLYGRPDGTWRVELPAEEVPPELPEPALGVNFARDGMAVRCLSASCARTPAAARPPRAPGGRCRPVAAPRRARACAAGARRAGILPIAARPGGQASAASPRVGRAPRGCAPTPRRGRARAPCASRAVARPTRCAVRLARSSVVWALTGRCRRLQRKDWLALVAVHSDAWLMAVAFYFAAKFDKAERCGCGRAGP